MIANFYNTFNKKCANNSLIPDEVLQIFLNELPRSYSIKRLDDGFYHIVPNGEGVMKFKIDKEFADKKLNGVPKNKLLEYMYRTQLAIPISNIRVGDEEKQIPIEKTVSNLLEEPKEIKEAYIYPLPFPKIKPLKFETADGDKMSIQFVRVPHSRFDEMVYENANYPSIKIKFVVNEETKQSRITFFFIPVNAKTIDELLATLHLFKGLYC